MYARPNRLQVDNMNIVIKKNEFLWAILVKNFAQYCKVSNHEGRILFNQTRLSDLSPK
jgi:hypothetical protein